MPWIDVDALLVALRERLTAQAVALAAHLPAVVVALVVLIAVWPVAGLVQRGAQRALRTARRRPGVVVLYGRMARWATIAGGILVALVLAVPGFTPAALFGALGIGSVAVGFAFKDIFENFLAGLLMLLREPFRIGDQIVVDGFEGTVEDIELRATHLRTYDGRRVVIPNVTVFTDAVTVNTAFEQRRTELTVGIAYDADLGHAKAVIVDGVSTVDEVLAEPAPDVLVTAFGDSAVQLTVRWWTDARRTSVVSSEDAVHVAVKEALDRAGIGIPFPIRTILLPGDRTASE